MATFDRLSDTQRTVLELLLAERKSYAYLAGKLNKTETEVRDIARGALVELTPITAFEVEEEWLAQLSDYLLGIQPSAEARAVMGHLRRSEAARTWARSVLDSLTGLYDGNVPSVPEPDGGPLSRGRATKRAVRREAKEQGEPSNPRALPPRRHLIGAGSLLAVLLAAVLVWPVGLLVGGSHDSGARRAASVGNRALSKNAQGQAVIARQGGKGRLVISAVGLRPSTQKQAYQVRLYNSPTDSRSLGFATANKQGQLQGGATLPSGFKRYRYIDVSFDPTNNKAARSNSSVLRGAIKSLKKPITQASGKNRATVTANFRLRPVSRSAG